MYNYELCKKEKKREGSKAKERSKEKRNKKHRESINLF